MKTRFWALSVIGTLLFFQAIAHAHSFEHRNSSAFRPSSINTHTNFNEQWQNRLIANWSLQQINANLPQLHDPYVTERLFNLTAQMNAQVRTQALLAVPVINDPQINAFAIPGGLIGINTGTILSAHSQDEYASVLAHEIAHLSQRHYEHNKDNKNKQLAIQLGGLLAAAVVSKIDGDGAAAAMIGSQTISAESAATHSREHEREADRIGMQILTGAGFDAKAMPRFFERLHRQSTLNTGNNAFIPSFVRSHPLSSERLSEARMRANAYPQKVNTDDQATAFDFLKWRISYLSKKSDTTELTVAAKTSTGAKLALIARLADLHQFEKATALFAQFSESQIQSDPLFCITKAHIFYEQGDFNQATQTLSACQSLYPERTDLRLYLADSLVMAGQDLSAEKLLAPLIKTHEHHILVWDLLQKNYEKRSQKSTNPTAKALANLHALRTRGKQELWTGNYEKALKSFAAAKDIAKTQNQTGLLTLLNKDSEQVLLYRDFKIK